jgi:hypothetical protein
MNHMSRTLEVGISALLYSTWPALRASELLSVTFRNTARPRHIFIWEKLVMIYTQYHKGQQQSGAYKDSIRFLRLFNLGAEIIALF